jgi:hypothetical protein
MANDEKHGIHANFFKRILVMVKYISKNLNIMPSSASPAMDFKMTALAAAPRAGVWGSGSRRDGRER